ncbi:hypothetical protein C8N40_109130 [Pontibacter mucosus]|uniref:Uncharacterized protein n=1 Tax=Pontibacter mucosus TaxID=1649266 RepID=A0A2T5YE90_9BACT|nr:hypothetical protein C8N40_109130 [Pontibacter mucosus]
MLQIVQSIARHYRQLAIMTDFAAGGTVFERIACLHPEALVLTVFSTGNYAALCNKAVSLTS